MLLPSPTAATVARPRIAVVKVSGLIDPINTDLLTHAVRDAESSRALVLIVQLNSTGGAVSGSTADRLAVLVRDSTVPVAVWVGGSGRPRAYGPAYEILRAAGFSGVGPGARVGRGPEPPGSPPPALGLATRTLGADEAVAQHVVDANAPVIGDFIVDLDGRTIGGHVLSLVEVVRVNGQPRRELRHDVDIAFAQLTVFPQLMHSVASPNVAFAMLLIALALAVFEFFTAGVGVAAATAAAFGAMAGYGLGVLPTRPLSVALIVAGVFGFAIDIQSGAPRAWTVIGATAVAVGSLRLYAGQSVSAWVLAIMAVLTVLFMVAGMPAMVRTRFSTPTIGRESMVGALGVALSGVNPEGTVEVNGAPWRARTNRATPIEAGTDVRVAAIDGLMLEVEPVEGAARDSRH
jgi:membrane-bound serine protease (ClpP class)